MLRLQTTNEKDETECLLEKNVERVKFASQQDFEPLQA